MKPGDYIERGGIEFLIYEKSIRIVGPDGSGSSLVFYGREPEEKDLQHIFMLIHMGAQMQIDHMRRSEKLAEIARNTNAIKDLI